MSRSLKVDVWTDMVCPWCLIGSAKFNLALKKLPDDVLVEVTHHPFLLNSDTPKMGVNRKAYLEEKFGPNTGAMNERLEQAALEVGVALKMDVQPMMYNTLLAHGFVRLAAPEFQYALAQAYAHAYFIEGLNISDPEVVKSIAIAIGYSAEDAEALLEDEEQMNEHTWQIASQAPAQGINGVPFFVFNEQVALSGAQPIEVFERAFRIALGEEEMPQQ